MPTRTAQNHPPLPAQINAPWLHDHAVQRIMRLYKNAGHDIRFVGGAVRDTLLGLPVHDIDMATTALPDDSMAMLEHADIKCVPTGIAHGTITAVLDQRTIEITTLRADIACDGRHAHVLFGTDWREDAKRRDFTINAIYADAHGAIHDEVNGLSDLTHRQVRFIGNAKTRIQEDALRILRFFRFWSRFCTTEPDAEALHACKTLSGNLSELSRERIGQEILATLYTRRAVEAFYHMRALDMEPTIWGGHINISQFEAVYTAARTLAKAPDVPLLLAALLWKTNLTPLLLAQQLRLSRQLQSAMEDILACPIAHCTSEADVKALIRQWGNSTVHNALLLHAPAIEPAKLEAWLALADQWSAPAFPLSGNDLLDAGMKPSAAVGEKLKELETAWEESHYTLTREALLQRL